MTKHLLSLLALAATAVAAPTPPALTFLYSVNLTMPAGTELGHVPYGSRALLPISGGTFSGPKLNGILPSFACLPGDSAARPICSSTRPFHPLSSPTPHRFPSTKPKSTPELKTETKTKTKLTLPPPSSHQTGKVGIGLDWGLTDAKGIFSPDAVYALHTDDNATIMVTEKGHAPHVHILFETSSDKYAWLNSIVGYATGVPYEGGVALDVWQVS